MILFDSVHKCAENNIKFDKNPYICRLQTDTTERGRLEKIPLISSESAREKILLDQELDFINAISAIPMAFRRSYVNGRYRIRTCDLTGVIRAL